MHGTLATDKLASQKSNCIPGIGMEGSSGSGTAPGWAQQPGRKGPRSDEFVGSLSTPKMGGLQFRWGFENRAGLEMEGTEEANCSFQGYLQGKIAVTMDKDHHICSSLEGTPRDRSASDRNVRSHQMVGRLVCECVHI